MGTVGLARKGAEEKNAPDLSHRFTQVSPTPLGRLQEGDEIVGTSQEMRSVLEWADAASHSTTPVLILGETGTGKELLARAIHGIGPRRDRPFVPVNCAALPHDLVESELFGHRRGAFSGALANHPGLFAFAHGGTLLLDEIGDLSKGAQAKLLRVLQGGEIRPVGGVEHRTVDVRIIAATNRSLRELKARALRQDLFYRLSALVIEVPPLRERSEDIPLLFEHFLARYRHPGTRLSKIEPGALDQLRDYAFPGNVRELDNLVQFLCTMLPAHRDTARVEDVAGWLHRQRLEGASDEVPGSGSLKLAAVEEWAIRTALQRARGDERRAARMLGISRKALSRKVRLLCSGASGPMPMPAGQH